MVDNYHYEPPLTPAEFGEEVRQRTMWTAVLSLGEQEPTAIDTFATLGEKAMQSVRDEPDLPDQTRVTRILSGLDPSAYDSVGLLKAKRSLEMSVGIAKTIGPEQILPDQITTEGGF